jgi:hypothetical protein
VANKIFKLDEHKHLGIVKNIRAGTERYQYLRNRFEAIFRGKRCIVLGSAPNCDAPSFQADDVVVCVNGSAHNAERFGVDVPDGTFLVSHIFGRSSKHSRATYELLRGRRTKNLILVTGTLNFEKCTDGVRDIGLDYEFIDELSPFERAAIVGEACGMELGFGTLSQRVSTGVTTVICAIWAGAREVNLTGFSLRSGHSYTNYASKRHHVGPDSLFFALCSERDFPVTTASQTLSRQFGISLR